MAEPSNREPRRRCRPRRENDRTHEVDLVELVASLHRNYLLLTNHGFITYRLAKELLSEELCDAAVEAGIAAVFVDPDTGQRVYAVVGG